MNKQPKSKIRTKGRWLFLAIVLLVYGIAALVDLSLVMQSINYFLNVLVQVVPVLGLVFLLMVLVNYFLTPQRVRQYVGHSSGLKGWLLALVAGIFSTGPIYSWYMLLSELKQQGMKPSLMAVFLYSRAVKLPLLPLLIHYFGLTYALVLSLYLLVLSVASGFMMAILSADD